MTEKPPKKSLIERYSEIPLARGAVNVLPTVAATAAGHPEFGLIGLAADGFFASVGAWNLGHFRKKLQEWLVALDDADVPLTDERMQTDDDYCLAVLTQTAIAARSHSQDKLHWMAMLLKNYDRIILGGSMEDFYDFQSILDDISARELQALLKLRELENRPDRPSQIAVVDDETQAAADADDFKWVQQIWPTLEDFVVQNGVPRNQLIGFFDRLQRTGLIRQFDVWDSKSAPGWRYTTASLDALVDAIAQHHEEKHQKQAKSP